MWACILRMMEETFVRKCLWYMNLGPSAPAAPAPKGKDLFCLFQCIDILVWQKGINEISEDLFKFFEREFFVHQIRKVREIQRAAVPRTARNSRALFCSSIRLSGFLSDLVDLLLKAEEHVPR